MYILGIETSCDETAAAIVKDGRFIISQELATSQELHEKTGGVVPEVAARKQVEFIVPVISSTLEKAQDHFGVDTVEEVVENLDKIAVTSGPGLIGSLVVGIHAAKTLSFLWKKPFVPVNHLVGHIYANFLEAEGNDPTKIEFPALVLIVSGGHTDLVLMRGHGDLEYIGGTLDDAAGEAFDKTARLLGIKKYLGGAELSKIAASCEVNNISGLLPRPKLNDPDFDFSFSGLKTAVRRVFENKNIPVEELSREFEDAVVDVLVAKTVKATEKYAVKNVLVGGGVAANKTLRNRLNFELEALGVPLFVPPVKLCTDNGVVIASTAYYVGKDTDISEVDADPSYSIMSAAS